ncbi:class I SAM-dependent methyltransferase [Sulfurimonas sp. HSL3-7]|uniref:class I SAM-dependent methyltransferase n=1 Tax=Sulfonitrofixus jiaomeiensis TaxID=3131938 RepID=UPI0031F87876
MQWLNKKAFDAEKYREMVRSHQESNDPTGWFDHIYRSAEGDHSAVFWADLAPNPCLVEWLKVNPDIGLGKKAIAVGCGVGDDAEIMTKYGYKVTAFDIAPSAIELCKNRYPESKVDYLVADLFDYPSAWSEAFDLVYECNTIQVLPGKYRIQARDAMISLLAKQGDLLVSCRSRLAGEQENDIPLPLDRYEIDGFVRSGLSEKNFLAYDDDQEPPVPHFWAWYRKA